MKKYGNGIDQFLADEPEISLTSARKKAQKRSGKIVVHLQNIIEWYFSFLFHFS